MHEPSKNKDGVRLYNQWRGNPKGTPEDPARCAAEVHHNIGFGRWFQCRNKRGHGPGGEYCKQHARMKGEKP